MPFCAYDAERIVRVGDRRDLVMINKMCLHEVQVYNRISLIPEELVVGETFSYWGK